MLHWLQANPGWLLMFDNVDSPEFAAQLDTLLPQLGSGQVLLAWSDPQLMQYDRSLATTWLTSYQQVSEAARTLLRRLAWLLPEAIPESPHPSQSPERRSLFSSPWSPLSQRLPILAHCLRHQRRRRNDQPLGDKGLRSNQSSHPHQHRRVVTTGL